MTDGGTSPEPLEIARRESRAVLDNQVVTARSIESESMQTIRSAGILLGILVSAAGIVGAERLSRVEPAALGLFSIGTVLLIGSLFLGHYGISNTTITYGINDRHRESAVNRDLRSDYLKEVLSAYDNWTSEMYTANGHRSRYLLWAHLCFITGVVSVTIGGGIILIMTLI